MRTRTLTGLGTVALAAGLIALASLSGQAADDAAGSYKLLVPASAADDLIKDDTKVVSDTLKAAKVEKKDIKRAKVATMLLGIYAEAKIGANKDKAKMEALQAQAAKVLDDLLKEDGLADAKKDAAKLSSPAAGKAEKVDWRKAIWDPENKEYDKDLAMQLFKSSRAGGLGYEKKIKDFAEKTATAKDMGEIAIMAYKAAMIGQVLEHIAPEKSQGGKKTPENWTKFAQDLQASAVETGNAAAKKDATTVKAAIGRMDKSCVNCHEVFKP